MPARGRRLACLAFFALACSSTLAGTGIAATPAGSSPDGVPLPTPSPVAPGPAQVTTPSAGVDTPLPVASPASDAVDALIARMSLADRVGQLFLLGFPGGDPTGAASAISDLRAGGVTLTTNVSSAAAARTLNAGLQRLASSSGVLPLLISVNHEGGDVQPISEGMTPLGPQWQIGQVQPLSAAVAAACSRGVVAGQELGAIGINMNLAPDLDVWDNPANTVIGERSFSSDPQVAAQLGVAYVEALQGQGVLATGKHFPGHGSSSADSHETLPVVMHDMTELESNELVPFKAAIQAQVAAIMVGHLSFPLVDPTPDQPSSLSPYFVSELLRNELGYQGLVVTDDIGAMKAVTDHYTAGQAAVQAILAGDDMVLSVGPLESEQEMVQAVTAAVGTTIAPERLNQSVRRVLLAKIQAGLLLGFTSDQAPPLLPPTTVCSGG